MIQSVSAQDEFSTSNYTAIEFLEDSILLAGFSRGFDKLTIGPGEGAEVVHVDHFDKSDGFIAMETNRGAMHKDNRGRMWFGTPLGVSVFDPALETKISGKPAVHLDDVKLFYKPVDWAKYNSQLTPWTGLPESLELHHKEKQLTFEFTGIRLRNSEKLLYSYFLEGADEAWSPYKSDRHVTYSGLRPGDYVFRVVAIDRVGQKSDQATFSFTIKPPWYQTIWFYMLSLAVIVMIVILFIRWRELSLKEENEKLENIVQERTAEVVHQKEEIEHKNKDITDSINYARKIQEAILPQQDLMESYLKDHFVIFKPKDIVSGDFYWFNENKGKMIFTAADCTGHGVPGAFMSMIGASLLNDAINERNISRPDKILNEIRNGVIQAMRQTGAEGEQKDGMDMALCSFEKQTNILGYSGANNPIYIVRDGSTDLKNNLGDDILPVLDIDGIRLFEIKSSKMPIGFYLADVVPFHYHEFTLEANDCVYSSSDGYADQFGGEKGKKFKYGKLKKLIMSLHKRAMADQKAELLGVINDWMGQEYEQIDDICIVGIRV